MTAIRTPRRPGPAAGLLCMLALVALAPGAGAQPPAPPLQAALAFESPPPATGFLPGAPISVRLQVRRTGTGTLYTPRGFTGSDFPGFLFTTTETGLPVPSRVASPVRHDIRPLHCFSAGGQPFRPTARTVLPVEALPTTFAVEYRVDLRTRFVLDRPDRYTVQARIPLLTVQANDAAALLTNCDQLPGTLLVVGTLPTSGTRQSFTILSNALEVPTVTYALGAFAAPLADDTACASLPCKTFRLGRVLPVKFQLLDAQGQVVPNAILRLAVSREANLVAQAAAEVLEAGASDTGDTFRYDPTDQQYIFNLDTKRLSVGLWRLDVLLGTGPVRSVHFGLQR